MLVCIDVGSDQPITVNPRNVMAIYRFTSVNSDTDKREVKTRINCGENLYFTFQGDRVAELTDLINTVSKGVS